MKTLAIMMQPAAAHITFGWFDLAWPNIAFWIAVILAFAFLTWARIPRAMEAGTDTRREGVDS